MKERPIIFSGPMVRAVLYDRKTQTRRVVKPKSGRITCVSSDRMPIVATGGGRGFSGCVATVMKCPYGQPGDRLWVRESWQFCYYPGPDGKPTADPVYRADGDFYDNYWKSPRFMPRWASRITLEIVSVRVERLQEISDCDAISEGVLTVRSLEWDRKHFPEFRDQFDAAVATKEKPPVGPSPREVFAALWADIHGPESWSENPWVWVIEFRRIQP